MATKSFLNLTTSSNARTNWITIVLGAAFGVLAFFKIIPDLQTAQSLGNDLSALITYVTTAAWGSVVTVAINLFNTIKHLLQKE